MFVLTTIQDLICTFAFKPPASTYLKAEKTLVFPDMKIALTLNTCENSTSTINKLQDIHKPVLLFCHGNAEDIGTGVRGCFSYCRFLAQECACDVISFDYPGYGQSSRTATSEKNTCESAAKVLAYITNTLLAQNIFLFGKSIGSVPALEVATLNCANVRGLFLQCPVATGIRTLQLSKYFPSAILQKCDTLCLDNVSRMKKVQIPVCIVHGRQDAVIPYNNSQVLGMHCAHMLEPVLLVGSETYPANHNNIELHYKEELIDMLINLMRKKSITV